MFILTFNWRGYGFVLCMSVNMYVFNVKSYKECHKDKKGIKKAATGFVSVPVSLISGRG